MAARVRACATPQPRFDPNHSFQNPQLETTRTCTRDECALASSIGKLTQQHTRSQQAVLGGLVVTGFDGSLALLFQPVRIEKLLALYGIGGTAVAHMRQLERHQALELDQVRRRRRGYRRADVHGSNERG